MTGTAVRAADPWDSPEEEEEVAQPRGDMFFSVANTVLRSRWWIIAGALVFASIAVWRKVRTPHTYTSSSRFISETSRGPASALSGLAAQFGVAVGGGNDSYSPQFYIDLVTSPVILRPAVENPYTFVTDSGTKTATLIQYFHTHAETPARSRELAVRQLQENLQADLSVKTGVVQLSVTAPNPQLAAEINQKLLELLDRFNTETRRSRATAERHFIEAQMVTAGSEVHAAEARMEDFLSANREYLNSPQLRFEYQRLNNAFGLSSQVYNSLAQGLEQAKVDEIRNTPVLTVVQPPVPAIWPDGRGTLKSAILAFMLGGLVGLGIGFLRERWRLPSTNDTDQSRQFRQLLADVRSELRSILTLGLWRRKRV